MTWRAHQETAAAYDWCVRDDGAPPRTPAAIVADFVTEDQARLIAAAPTMLEALQQIEREMRAGFGSSFGETREQIRRAIALATGQKT